MDSIRKIRSLEPLALFHLALLSGLGLPGHSARADTPYGTLQVTLLPASAANGNALWQVDGGYDLFSDAMLVLPSGSHSISFPPLGGWLAPLTRTFTVPANQTSDLAFTYMPAAVVTTFAGSAGNFGSADGAGGAARFSEPYALAVDSSGNVYIADTDNCTIRKATPDGVVTTLAGTAGIPGSANGNGTAAQFCYPKGIAVDGSGNIYIADTVFSIIRKVTPSGVVTTLAGSPGLRGSTDGKGGGALFSQPCGIAVDGSGNVYVADTYNDTIRMITPAGVVTTLAGTPGAFGSSDGTGGAARFRLPHGIAVDGSGNVYVADTYNYSIRKVTAAGAVSTIAGSASASGTADGTGSAATFDFPWSIAVDGSGNAFIAEADVYTIRKMTAAGVVTTLAGYPQQPGATDGNGSAATFNHPYGVATDGSGNLYVADAWNGTIRKMALSQLPPLPVFSVQPASQTLADGATAAFSAATSTPYSTYQWYFDGAVLSGATGPTLVVQSSSATAGPYTCLATNPTGSTLSAAATLQVVATASPGRLVNLSVLAFDSAGTQALTVGLVTGGAGTSGSQMLLVRATGPALAAFGVTGTLPDPAIILVNAAGTTLGSNSGWASTPGNQAAVTTADAATFAFPLADPASLDSAVVETLSANAYSVQVDGKSGDAGWTLAEIYDDTPAGAYRLTTPRLVNVSCKVGVNTQGSVAAGFTIGGTTSKTVLVRASGPALKAYGVGGVMPDPQIQLFAAGTQIASNAGWGGSPQLAAAMSAVYAFPYQDPASADSAILITLPPGGYSAQGSSVTGTGGITLIEVYEVP